MSVTGGEIVREEYHQWVIIGVRGVADACAWEREPGGLDNDHSVKLGSFCRKGTVLRKFPRLQAG